MMKFDTTPPLFVFVPFVAALFGITGSSEARSPMSKAQTVIEAAKRATGGKNWDTAAGCHEEGSRAGGITYTIRFSLEKYGMRLDSQRGGNVRSMGYDGKVMWQSMGDKADIRADPESLKEAKLTNYLSINGFFFPNRFPATFKYLREEAAAGRKFDVLEITAEGTRPLEIWFDRRTHLIDKVIDTQATPPVTVVASTHRRFGSLLITDKLIVTGADGNVVDTGTVTSFRCGQIDSSAFAPPHAR